MDVVDVAKTKTGAWMLTLNGSWVGDSRPQATREAAIAYARQVTKGWVETVLAFDGPPKGENVC